MFGAIVMIPLYMQVVKGYGATEAGLKLIPLMIGIVSTSIFSGKAISRTGKYKRFPIAGTAIMTLGILAMATLESDSPYWQLAIFATIVGVGLGLSMQTIVIALQNAVEFKDMGVATSSNTFFRSLGSVFGTAFFGAVLTNRLNHYISGGFADLAQKYPQALAGIDKAQLTEVTSNTAGIDKLPHEVQTTVIDSFVNSFHVVFFVAAPVTLLGVILALFLRETPLRTNEDYRAARQESAGEALG
jgi:MFS family permease